MFLFDSVAFRLSCCVRNTCNHMQNKYNYEHMKACSHWLKLPLVYEYSMSAHVENFASLEKSPKGLEWSAITEFKFGLNLHMNYCNKFALVSTKIRSLENVCNALLISSIDCFVAVMHECNVLNLESFRLKIC
ncbi:hypothetical protein M758_UG131400 [Ceratodon purpureus]|nr:hypothetical protein M758_UG131400 [Ceratodon purpureus]